MSEYDYEAEKDTFTTNFLEGLDTDNLNQDQKKLVEDLKLKWKKRDEIFNKLMKVETSLAQFQEGEISVYQLKANLSLLVRIKNQFDTLQNQIYANEFSNEADEEDNEVVFMTHFHKIESETTKIVEEPQEKPKDLKPSLANVKVKLPQQKIPEFYGDITSWRTFKDTFVSLIHSNDSIPNIQKYHYLISALKNDTNSSIKEMPITEDNYTLAWEILKERYDNTNLLIEAHLDKLFALPSMSKENASDLRKLIDVVQSNVRALAALKVPVGEWDAILVYMVKQKLDSDSKKQWQLSVGTKEPQKYEKLLSFLNNRCNVLESIKTQKQSKETSDSKPAFSKFKPKSISVHATETSQCNLCKGSHRLFYCPDFLQLNPNQRKAKVRELNLCFKCLGSHSKECSSRKVCKICNDASHNTLLHINEGNKDVQKRDPEKKNVIPVSTTACVQVHCHRNGPSKYSQVLMGTAIIQIANSNGSWHQVRALLDSASQSCFISEDLVQKLGLKRQRSDVPVSGIDQIKASIKYKVKTQFKSRVTPYQEETEFLVVSRIANNSPCNPIDIENWNIPSQLILADPNFFTPGRIDVLIGTRYFYEIMKSEKVEIGRNKPMLIDSELGWVVAGGFSSNVPSKTSNISFCWLTQEQEFKSKSSMSPKFDFKEVEFTEEDMDCENHFRSTIKRNEKGRYVVRLPIKPNAELGESKSLAVKRLKQLQKQLNGNPAMKSAYVDFMSEYIKLGHMEVLKSSESNLRYPYYIPHHAVYKLSSTTTKLRVVFNASSKTTNQKSLNDILMVGPNLQIDMRILLLNFTLTKYAFIADVEKLFRQLEVDPEDRDYLRVLWWDESGEVIECRLTTVTYGTACAPYQALRVLLQLVMDLGSKYKLGQKLILKKFMDDFLAGGNNLSHLIEAIQELIQMLAEAGMNLRKFAANDPRLLQNIPPENIEKLVSIQSHDNAVSTLGLVWNPESDEFMFKIPKIQENVTWTKRKVLSEIHKLFDPEGWVGPVTLLGNLIMQQIWIEGTDWDAPLPAQLQREWIHLYTQLPLLQQIHKKRLTVTFNREIQLIGFSDASLRAYGATLYIRSQNEDGQVSVQLLCSQSRVAPQPNKRRKKPVTLPKLELNAAALLAQLASKMKNSLEIEFSNCFLFSDSTIVLSWINEDPSKFVQYVARRVRDIQKATESEGFIWNHIESKQNAADIISRGMLPEKLIQSDLWWHGPIMFQKQYAFKITQNFAKEINEESTCYLLKDELQKSETESIINIQNFTNYDPMIRITAWILRFIHNSRLSALQKRDNTITRLTGALSVGELSTAEKSLVKQIQSEAYPKEMQLLHQGKPLNKDSKLCSLSPTLKDNIMVVGGRLSNSNLSVGQKHPMIIPATHHFTKLLIQKIHQQTLHGGPQLVLATIRRKFWIPQSKSKVRQLINQCLICFRVKPIPAAQIMGDLPVERVVPSRPFSTTGLDYCGPFYVQNKTPRPTASIKIWVCIFVCFSTKAAHLEPVMDLTTEAFRNALIRFQSRRGKCTILNSDNQTSFHGANRKMEKEIAAFLADPQINDEIKALCAKDGITWRFIPARCPHVGGLWEACVRSFKHHFKRVASDSPLSIESFFTLVYSIESCLNSRPLVQLSEDAEEDVLTPGHFLIGEALNAPAEPELTNIPYNRLTHFERKQKMIQLFWKSWSRDYLNTLQQKYKWKVEKNDLQIGDIVLIIEDNLPPSKWMKGRITATPVGTDGRVRMVSMQTKDRVIKRSVHRICPLPKDTD